MSSLIEYLCFFFFGARVDYFPNKLKFFARTGYKTWVFVFYLCSCTYYAMWLSSSFFVWTPRNYTRYAMCSIKRNILCTAIIMWNSPYSNFSGNAWILTREKFPSLEVMERAYAVLDQNHINRNLLIRTDQNNCPEANYDIDHRPLFDFSFNNHIPDDLSKPPVKPVDDNRLRRRVDHGVLKNNRRKWYFRRSWGVTWETLLKWWFLFY